MNEVPKRSEVADEPDSPPAGRKPVRAWRWLGVIAALLVLAGWLAHLHAKGQLEAYKRQLIAKGEKLTIEENLPPPPPVGVTNGAKAFLSAAHGLGRFPVEIAPGTRLNVEPGKALATWQQERLPAENLRGKFIADVWPGVREAVQSRQDTLDEVAAIARGPFIGFDVKYTVTWFTPVSSTEVNAMRDAMQWLPYGAMIHLRDGQPSEAWTNWHTMIRLVSTLRDEHTTLWQLWRWSLMSRFDDTTWACLQYAGWSDEQLATIQREIEAAVIGDLAAALRMDRAIGAADFSHLRRRWDYAAQMAFDRPVGAIPFWQEIFHDPAKIPGALRRASWLARWPLWTSYEDERVVAEYDTACIAAAELVQKGGKVSLAMADVDHAYGKLTNTAPHFLVTAGLAEWKGRQSLFRSWTRKFVVRDTTITAIALRRHQLRHGRYPKSLDALVPDFLSAVPRDVFDGQPLRYRLQADGEYLLYSVGENGVDEGGNPNRPPGVITRDWTHGLDYVWPQRASEAEVAAYIADIDAKITSSLSKP